MRFSRNPIVLAVSSVSMLLVTTACGSDENSSSGADTEKVRIALSAFQDVNSVHVGIEKGFFEDLGVELDIQNSDWPSANELLVGGHVDLANACESDVMLQNAQGNDTTLALSLIHI